MRDSRFTQLLMAIARTSPDDAAGGKAGQEPQASRPASQLLVAIARTTPAFSGAAHSTLSASSGRPIRVGGTFGKPAAPMRDAQGGDLLAFGHGQPPIRQGGSYRHTLSVAAAAFAVLAVIAITVATRIVVYSQARSPLLPVGAGRPTMTTFPTATRFPTAIPKPALAVGVTPLLQLLPQDIANPTTQCSAVKKPDWKSPGLVSGLICDDPDLPNGLVSAYQMDSNADYSKTWQNFNAWSRFDVSTARPNCPPPGSGAEGMTPWNNKAGFPAKQGQVLECWTGSKAAPIYVWTLPTQDAFIIAVGADGSTFQALDAWWHSASSSPVNAPAATPSPQAS
jgi:hypothetical protein